MSVLWLHDNKLSSKMSAMHELMLVRAGIPKQKINLVNIRNRVPDMWIKKPGTKNKYIRNAAREQQFFEYLDGLIERLSVTTIIVQDSATLNYITREQTSLNLCRGSVYFYKSLPVIVIDEPKMLFSQREGRWIFQNDYNKVARWYNGKQRYEPRFTYTVCRNRSDLDKCLAYARDSFIASSDIETFNKYISCAGYTFMQHNGNVHTFVIPFLNTQHEDRCHWRSAEDEIYAWKTVSEINANPNICKILQNGTYDASYFVIYNCPLVNYICDTAVAMHSLFTEAPKKLNFISSIFLDFGRYWKDEMKGDKKDAKKSERIPFDNTGLERYWRYNALDCHYTLLNWFVLCILLLSPQYKWALKNYDRAFSISVGPAFAKNMRGMSCSRFAMMAKHEDFMREHHTALDIFRTMCDDFQVNPNSDAQMASLIYDVLGANQIKAKSAKQKGGRTVDKRILRLICDQHPMFRVFIEAIWACKEPLNNASKYGNIHLINKRFLTSFGITRTGTERYGSGEHSFHVGTNAQNMPYQVRDMLHADEGYFLANFDYSQSDGWFIAYESEEQRMIEIMNDPRDTHCIHAEHFFGIAYDKIYEAHKVKADWTDHPIEGVRQNTKRIVHGANFRMAAWTLYQTMGHKAVVAAGKTVGRADADGWTQNQASAFCGEMLVEYHKLYPGLERNDENWYDKIVKECVANGNLATNCHGFTHRFFGDVAKDKAIQRELTAFFGQSGTSGNINNSMLDIYYKSGLDDGDKCMMLLQVHDSLLFQIRLSHLHLVNEIKKVMEREVTIHGRTFVVPVDCEVGWHWGKGMLRWRDDLSIKEIMATKDSWERKYIPEGLVA